MQMSATLFQCNVCPASRLRRLAILSGGLARPRVPLSANPLTRIVSDHVARLANRSAVCLRWAGLWTQCPFLLYCNRFRSFIELHCLPTSYVYRSTLHHSAAYADQPRGSFSIYRSQGRRALTQDPRRIRPPCPLVGTPFPCVAARPGWASRYSAALRVVATAPPRGDV
jgi:hypothetical protein